MPQCRPTWLQRPAPPPFDGLYRMPAPRDIEQYLLSHATDHLDLPETALSACSTAVATQLGNRSLAQTGIEALTTLTVNRTLAVLLASIPSDWVAYTANSYAMWAVRFAKARAARTEMPSVNLSAHHSETGVFVME